jgi:hypothetical protein
LSVWNVHVLLLNQIKFTILLSSLAERIL